MMRKVANEKKTPATKMEKLQNVLRSKTMNRQLSIYDLWQFVMFCIKVGTCINERKPHF